MSNQGFFKNLMILMEIFQNDFTLLNNKKKHFNSEIKSVLITEEV